MRTLYIECNMGAAGDMLMSALYELMDEEQKEEFLKRMNGLGLPGVKITPRRASTCGISGTHMEVTVYGKEEHEPGHGHDGLHADHHGHEHGELHHGCHGHGHEEMHGDHHGHRHDGLHHAHHHADPLHIAELIDGMDLPEEVRGNARKVYDAIADAEAKAHGCPVEQVHFHEVGALDAVADVAGVCYAIYLLKPERIAASPVHVGSGTVRCAHGIMPVPAPATANLLADVPMYGGSIRGELCTPTGAALLVNFAEQFGDMPMMSKTRVGIGVGTKEFAQANCVRVFLGETPRTDAKSAGVKPSADVKTSAGFPAAKETTEEKTGKKTENGSIAELVCNIDDMTPEALAFAAARLLELGALDAYTVAGTMKKGRPGWVLTVLCETDQIDETAKNIMRETTTNGVRVRLCGKYFLTPGSETVRTEWGQVRIKTAEGFGIRHEKPEYEDTAACARKAQMSYREAYEKVLALRKEQAGKTERGGE